MGNLRKHNIAKNQQGLVSIIVVMIIIIVLSLIVIGFAQIARREQRQALDRQLSDQAQYAAESGINDAVAAITSGNLTVNDETCNYDGDTFNFNYDVDSATGVEITCLLVKQDPEILEYTIGMDQSKYFEMNFPQNAESITLKWENVDGTAGTRNDAALNFPTINNWGDNVGLLKFTLTDLVPGYERKHLNNNTLTAYLYPNTVGSSTVSFGSRGAVDQGQIIATSDCVDGLCTATITGLINTTKAFMRLTAIYKDLNVEVSAKSPTSVSLNISGAQAQIDVTAKANDVVKRVRAAVPVKNYFANSSGGDDYAVQSVTGICKLLNVAPNYGRDDCP